MNDLPPDLVFCYYIYNYSTTLFCKESLKFTQRNLIVTIPVHVADYSHRYLTSLMRYLCYSVSMYLMCSVFMHIHYLALRSV